MTLRDVARIAALEARVSALDQRIDELRSQIERLLAKRPRAELLTPPRVPNERKGPL